RETTNSPEKTHTGPPEANPFTYHTGPEPRTHIRPEHPGRSHGDHTPIRNTGRPLYHHRGSLARDPPRPAPSPPRRGVRSALARRNVRVRPFGVKSAGQRLDVEGTPHESAGQRLYSEALPTLLTGGSPD